MGESYKISVIITTYNDDEYIEECLDSVVSQTLKPIEIIVVNDGSTDNTYDILSRYEKNYSNIFVINQENIGQALSTNKAMDLVNGEFFVFMDSDDKYPNNDCLEKMYNAAMTNGALLCGGNIITNNQISGQIEKRYDAGDGDDKHSKNCFINVEDYYFLYGHTRFLYNSQMMRENNVRHGLYERYGDQELTLGALCAAGKFYELDYPVYEYRLYQRNEIRKEKTWFDMMSAFRDTIRFMLDHDMKRMYVENAFIEFKKMLPSFYSWTCNDSRWSELLGQIMNCMKEDSWSDSYGMAVNIVKETDGETSKMRNIVDFGKPIVLYGAGYNTRRLIKKIEEKKELVRGIAVTNKGTEDYLDEIEVKPITDYIEQKRDIYVVVTPCDNAGAEMFEYAKTLGFEYVERINVDYVANMI